MGYVLVWLEYFSGVGPFLTVCLLHMFGIYAKLSSKGQFTIPIYFRQILKLERDSVIKVVLKGNKLILVPVRVWPYPGKEFVSMGRTFEE